MLSNKSGDDIFYPMGKICSILELAPTLQMRVANMEILQTGTGRHQCLAQAIQPNQTSSRVRYAATSPCNLTREMPNYWYGNWGLDTAVRVSLKFSRELR